MKKVSFILIILLFSGSFLSGKKVKNSFTIKKEKQEKTVSEPIIKGREINLSDSLEISTGDYSGLISEMTKVNFTGYDKEPNSNIESFILVNPTDKNITGYKVKIEYLDMQGRMLHSREIENACYVPHGETRRFDHKSWDYQHTYYYYLGNEPKRVATPFQVLFVPQVIWIEE